MPAHSRILWLPLHAAIVATSLVILSAGWIPWPLAFGPSLLIGLSFAGLTFLAHEALHGAVIRNLFWRRLLGSIAFLPFMISPRLWTAWHNRVHHGNTNRAGADPDAYPTLDAYEKSPSLRVMTDRLGPGGQRINGVLSLIVGFSVQSAHMLFRARRLGLLSRREQRLALLETAIALAFWIAIAVVGGGSVFVFGLLLPLLIANAIVMSFILTNHSLSPLSEVNDPLLNSLSVTLPRGLEWLSLRFGYHVEHHLFPAMSSRHAPLVRALVRARWPQRYQSMPLVRALWKLHCSGRVYKNATTLVDMPSQRESKTLLPSNWTDTAHQRVATPHQGSTAHGTETAMPAEHSGFR